MTFVYLHILFQWRQSGFVSKEHGQKRLRSERGERDEGPPARAPLDFCLRGDPAGSKDIQFWARNRSNPFLNILEDIFFFGSNKAGRAPVLHRLKRSGNPVNVFTVTTVSRGLSPPNNESRRHARREGCYSPSLLMFTCFRFTLKHETWGAQRLS